MQPLYDAKGCWHTLSAAATDHGLPAVCCCSAYTATEVRHQTGLSLTSLRLCYTHVQAHLPTESSCTVGLKASCSRGSVVQHVIVVLGWGKGRAGAHSGSREEDCVSCQADHAK